MRAQLATGASARRTAGATSVPKSSIERITSAWGRVPTLNWMRKRSWSKISCWKQDLLDRPRPGCRRSWRRRGAGGLELRRGVIGGQPRSRPMRSIIRPWAGKAASAAAWEVSATKPWELIRARARVVAGLAGGAAVQLDERREARRLAADDRQRHRQPERAGADDRLRRAADRDPDRQRVLDRARVDAAAVDRRRGSRPGQVTLSPRATREQQLELLGEQLVVVVEVVAEEREGLDERAAAGHDLRAAAGEQVERGEVLEDAHRVVGADAP